MKKLFIYFFAFICICFILPAILTKRDINALSDIKSKNISFENIVENNQTDMRCSSTK